MDPLLGIDIGGTKCAVVLGSRRGDEVRIDARTAFPTPSTWRAALDRLIAEGRVLLAGRQPEAVGIACGGPLDAVDGLVLSPPNLPGWDRVPVAAEFADAFGCPARLENDADAGALAEWRWGAGRGCTDLAFLTCGTGLGAGLVLGGRLHRGASGLAGEIGHCRISDHGPIGYGKAGSAEGWASGGGLDRAAHPRWSGAAEVFASDEPEARALVDGFARGLGRTVAVLSDLLDVQAVVIGSLFVRQEARLRPAVESAWRAEALPGVERRCRILPAGLGDAVGDHACLAAALGDSHA